MIALITRSDHRDRIMHDVRVNGVSCRCAAALCNAGDGLMANFFSRICTMTFHLYSVGSGNEEGAKFRPPTVAAMSLVSARCPRAV